MDFVKAIVDTLFGLGYSPDVIVTETQYDIHFVSFGFNSFKGEYKDTIRNIAGDKLSEFYYETNTQHIIIEGI